MHIIGSSGSPREGGNTDRLVRQALAGAAQAGAKTQFYRVADLKIHGCVACLGFSPGEIVVATGTRATDDVERQPNAMQQAHAVGTALASGLRSVEGRARA